MSVSRLTVNIVKLILHDVFHFPLLSRTKLPVTRVRANHLHGAA